MIQSMQIRNLSNLAVPTRLWHALADIMKVGARLPKARWDRKWKDYGEYGKCRVLRVTVRPVRVVEPGRVLTAGTYTSGTINLFPCPKCSPAFLTHLLLHELVHVWLDQYHRDLYWNSEALAERFADAGFMALGGRIRPRRVCGSYRWRVREAERRIPAFARLAASLVENSPRWILRWRPARITWSKSS